MTFVGEIEIRGAEITGISVTSRDGTVNDVHGMRADKLRFVVYRNDDGSCTVDLLDIDRLIGALSYVIQSR